MVRIRKYRRGEGSVLGDGVACGQLLPLFLPGRVERWSGHSLLVSGFVR